MNDNKKRKKEKTKKRKKKKTRTELPREAKKKKLADVAPTETAPEEPPKKRKYKRRDKSAVKAPAKGEPNEHGDFNIDDLHTLITRIEGAVPVSDTLHYEVSSTKLNWRSISFNGHSPKKCQDAWNAIQKKQRSFRLLSEVMADVKEYCKMKYHLDFVPTTTTNTEFVGALDRPEKPPFCGYSLYLKKLMKEGELKQCSNNTWMKFVAERWKELPQNEKDSYNEQAKELKNQYKVDYSRFIASLPREQRELELLNNMPKKRKEKKAEPEEPQSDLIAAVKPALWDDMSVEDKLVYQKCILKVRNYFEQQCASDQQSENDDSSSESGSDSDSSNN